MSSLGISLFNGSASRPPFSNCAERSAFRGDLHVDFVFEPFSFESSLRSIDPQRQSVDTVATRKRNTAQDK